MTYIANVPSLTIPPSAVPATLTGLRGKKWIKPEFQNRTAHKLGEEGVGHFCPSVRGFGRRQFTALKCRAWMPGSPKADKPHKRQAGS
jgi:hypothetical protein